jgi:hypothetical protein
VPLVVDPQELFARGRGRLDELEAQPVPLREGLLDRCQASRILGVPAGVVQVRAGMTDVEASDPVTVIALYGRRS